MAGNEITVKDLVQMINSVMGQRVLTEQQMEQILAGAKRAHDRGGMNAVLEYLMKVTRADVDFKELKQFADSIRADPSLGMDILQGKKKVPRKKK
ncbi:MULTISPECIES: hypothetical protein [Thermoactinomyces]|uniref:Uncharacterized protein n=1 Tax=Thermoactinomyces daqus TaxID=1329516 RepID=A0A7W2AIV6_9BACL|nr:MULTISPECIES: hypothetical protein [Thermoactinomyces]MBA4543660.1 hypothetical protein [Thermoactinomyces daqus]MBH8597111.1 hypothetical protein [Thermoactinomyces sp. CICC 10523]MBH8602671.1 hypothetical protein [Thermoactinomyces sp. CICC 10522]MBH8606218.1 hypothetical protein [Thermoactinomyces sp. CICC 10521]